MLFTPPPSVTNGHTFSNPLPLEPDVLYGWPLNTYNSNFKIHHNTAAQQYKLNLLSRVHGLP